MYRQTNICTYQNDVEFICKILESITEFTDITLQEIPGIIQILKIKKKWIDFILLKQAN